MKQFLSSIENSAFLFNMSDFQQIQIEKNVRYRDL